MELTVFHELAIALGLGLIVGFQREWAESQIAGVRTFPIIAVFGAVCGIVGETAGAYMPAVGLGAVAGLVVMANVLRLKTEHADPGMTTEIAVLVMYGVGVLTVLDLYGVAVVVAGAMAVLLHWKDPLHKLVASTNAQDLGAVAQLVLIGLVILPVLPDEGYGPYGVVNPFRIWLMVVLIVGISLAAYVAFKLLGARAGVFVAGILGGLISSTATTVSAARSARNAPASTTQCATIILLASTVVFGRVLFEIAIVARELLREMAIPIGAMMLILAAMTAAGVLLGGKPPKEGVTPSQSPGLKTAIAFGLTYMVVLLAVAWARDYFGDSGLYLAAAISGLTDMDAITLSTAELTKTEGLDPGVAWRVILTGALANLVFKGGMAGALGGPKLLARIAPAFLVAIGGGAALILFWPR